jgi:hypothetical protein
MSALTTTTDARLLSLYVYCMQSIPQCYEPQDGGKADYVQQDNRIDNGPRSSKRSAPKD